MSTQNQAVIADFRRLIKPYHNLIWHHCTHSVQCDGDHGLPDLLIIGPGAVLWRECKPHRHAHLSPGQVTWRYTIQAAGADWAIWTPEDVEDGTMDRDLRHAAGLPATSCQDRPGREIHAPGRGGRCECGAWALASL